jgi:hypothetical protein
MRLTFTGDRWSIYYGDERVGYTQSPDLAWWLICNSPDRLIEQAIEGLNVFSYKSYCGGNFPILREAPVFQNGEFEDTIGYTTLVVDPDLQILLEVAGLIHRRMYEAWFAGKEELDFSSELSRLF